MSGRTKVDDARHERKYFMMIPNMVDDMGLSLIAYRLYGHFKRVAGETGASWQSTDTLAKSCNMSQASVSRAKRELLARKLITLDKRKEGPVRYDHIEMVDIWPENMARYAKARRVSLGDEQVSV